ncbi:hypothetical protein SCHPADRAFT_398643 [Schizopora paradoxa]|uniref:WKF domain-containing protein n=1 Tax=Schizopora paradoxa TaxID=27342 RepID=A0A0H2S7J2_9AGAM|nr:hypothetical protein SCHPADRAFT_398643 [Schizopora paradoxa]
MGDKEQSAGSGGKVEKKKKAKSKEVKFDVQEDSANNGKEETSKPKRSKKRKSKEEEDTTKVDEEVKDELELENSKPSVEKDPKTKKKTKKQRRSDKSSDSSVSGFPDPSEDSSLSEKAQNALSNALLRIAYPELWKFNKASQNWLMKNFWVPEAVRISSSCSFSTSFVINKLEKVPEKYVPIVVGYLAGSEGGIRTKLIESCKEKSQALPENEKAEESTPKSILKKDEPKSADTSVRAAVLLKALS